MARRLYIPVWKTAPFIRLLPPLVAGIIVQWYVQPTCQWVLTGMACFIAAAGLFVLLPSRLRYKFSFIQGIAINLLIGSIGALICWKSNDRNRPDWYGHSYTDSSQLVLSILEPPIVKARSIKAEARVQFVITHGNTIPCSGKLLLYFAKDSVGPAVQYGDQLLITKKLQHIRNSGNPGAFNYERYAAFQQLFHSAYLQTNDWMQLPQQQTHTFQQFIFQTRKQILQSLRKYIAGGMHELGIAEALLIGYTNDLDKDLVQAYSNTGVVHIIAISGMHLALIYGMLTMLFGKLPFIKRFRLLQALLILACLWIFSLLTGGAASVLRSAVMFTFITLGKYLVRQSNIYNSLAASAMAMLCYNPYYLWDVGFQLSYLAVLGIVGFQKPIYNLLYVPNKWLDYIWQASALTTAAQLLTFPVCIYYFHQFPTLFLLTNLLAVPVSTIILYAEIGLVLLAWIAPVATVIGKLIGWLLALLNQFIVWVNHFPFAVWDQIPATVATTWLLYATILLAAAWLIHKKPSLLRLTLASLAGFLLLHICWGWQVRHQQKIIIYHVPRYQAIDFVSGQQYQFVGDTVLLEDGLLQNFHLKPGRIALQLYERRHQLPQLSNHLVCYQFGNKRLAIIDSAYAFQPVAEKIKVDAVLLSKNAAVKIADLQQVFNCSWFVFDGSNSLWKIGKWKQACDELHLRHYSIPEQGAFILDL